MLKMNGGIYMSKKLKIYIGILFITTILSSLYWFSTSKIDVNILPFFIILMIFAEAYKVPVMLLGSKEHVKISWSLVISISALIGGGIGEAIIVNLIGGLICSVFPKRLPLIKIIYNFSSYGVSIILTYTIFLTLQIYDPILKSNPLLELIYVPILYLVINFSISAFLMKILSNRPLKSILIDFIGPYYHHYILFSFVGGIQGYFYKENGLNSLLLTSVLVGVIIHSFRRTAINANVRITELEESNQKFNSLANELDQTLEQFIQTLTATIDARDPYTYGHSLQVSNYAFALANELELDAEESNKIRIAGLLHDIGKISIPESILFKTGRLTEEEYSIMKTHSEIGKEILSGIPRLSSVATLVGMHHERYNGSGYPNNLKTNQILIGAHILGVADTLDAILSNRSYKDEKNLDEAFNEFKRCRGTTFHPEVVDALFNLRGKLGDEAFCNSAKLVDQSVVTGNTKTNRGFILKY